MKAIQRLRSDAQIQHFLEIIPGWIAPLPMHPGKREDFIHIKVCLDLRRPQTALHRPGVHTRLSVHRTLRIPPPLIFNARSG